MNNFTIGRWVKVNNIPAEVIGFIEFLKKQTYNDNTKVMKSTISPKQLYKYYFIYSGKSFFVYEKGMWKILESFNIFTKNGGTLNFGENNYEEFKKLFSESVKK
jgi:hypothetical protein